MIIYLYVKTHNKTGLKYLGKTSKNPHTYLGSGIDWKAHLKEHGTDHTTEIIKECNSNKELSVWGRYYSKLWNVADSNTWANRIPETGGGSNHPESRRDLFRQQQLGRKRPPRTDEHKEKLSQATKGKTRPRSLDHQKSLTDSIKTNWSKNDDRRSKTATVGKANRGRKHNPETIEKKRQAMLEYWKIKKSQVS